MHLFSTSLAISKYQPRGDNVLFALVLKTPFGGPESQISERSIILQYFVPSGTVNKSKTQTFENISNVCHKEITIISILAKLLI